LCGVALSEKERWKMDSADAKACSSDEDYYLVTCKGKWLCWLARSEKAANLFVHGDRNRFVIEIPLLCSDGDVCSDALSLCDQICSDVKRTICFDGFLARSDVIDLSVHLARVRQSMASLAETSRDDLMNLFVVKATEKGEIEAKLTAAKSENEDLREQVNNCRRLCRTWIRIRITFALRRKRMCH
jgi:hypothetical protein